jgi:hypothetical protein
MTEKAMTQIEARRIEVEQYAANIAMYEAIYSNLPHEWPDHLVKYRGASEQHKTVDKIESLDDVELLSKLWYADECHRAVRSETVEMTKAKAILTALEAQS